MTPTRFNAVIRTLQAAFGFLSAPQRRSAWGLTLFSLAFSLVEAVALALILPLVALLGGEPVAPPFDAVLSVVGLGGAGTDTQATAVAVAVAVLFLVRSLMSIAATWWSATLAKSVEVGLVTKILSGAADDSLERRADRNSSAIIRTVTISAPQAAGLINTALLAVGDLVLLVLMGTVIVLASPLVGLAAVVYAALVSIVWTMVVATTLTDAGRRAHHFAERQVRYVSQGVAVAKELQIRGRAQHFAERGSRATADKAAALRVEHVLIGSQRYVFDALLLIGVALVAAIVILTGGSQDILALLALLVAASFRAMPSIGRLVTFVNQAQYGAAPVAIVEAELNGFDVRGAADDSAPQIESLPRGVDPLLRVDQLRFAYASRSGYVLNDVSFDVLSGESIGIVGTTGSGKSTLLDILLGLLEPSAGSVLVHGLPISAARRAWQERIGYVPQETVLIDESVRANIALGYDANEIDERAVERAIRLASLNTFIASLAEGLDTIVGEHGVRLSGGQRQRIGLARALYRSPEVLILDEATSNLDMRTEAGIIESIEALRGSVTVLTVAHRMETVRRSDRILYLQDGRVHGIGSFEELESSSPAFRRFVASASRRVEE